MDLLSHFEILDPPTKYINITKREKKETTYYLTANLFYGGNVHWAMMRKITNYAKDFIMPFLITVPKMEKCRLELIYHHPNASFDLDNKAYFWIKILLDLFTPPTEKELESHKEKGYPLKSIYVLEDDSVKQIDDIRMSFKRGRHKLELKIYGRLATEQKKLF